jgi:hypothetical protein
MHEAWRSPEKMGDLSERDVEDVLGGVQPPGRDDLAPVVELTTWLHVSREIEPPPAMRDDLFCQIEDGPAAYQRSSRRLPAHLGQPDRMGMRRLRNTLAGSGRPIASVAAAAVLLVGVTLAVRAGGPARQPSASVSRSAEGFPAAGRDPASSSTTVASTTTAPAEAASPADSTPTTATSPDRDEPAVSDSDAAGSAGAQDTPHDTPPTSNPPARSLDLPPPAPDGHGDGSNDYGVGAKSVDTPSGTREGAPPQPGTTDETGLGDMPLSGWLFDLSRWPAARELWAALDGTGDGDGAVDPDMDDRGDPGDGDRSDDDGATSGDDDTDRYRNGGAESGAWPQDDGDPDPEGSDAG